MWVFKLPKTFTSTQWTKIWVSWPLTGHTCPSAPTLQELAPATPRARRNNSPLPKSKQSAARKESEDKNLWDMVHQMPGLLPVVPLHTTFLSYLWGQHTSVTFSTYLYTNRLTSRCRADWEPPRGSSTAPTVAAPDTGCIRALTATVPRTSHLYCKGSLRRKHKINQTIQTNIAQVMKLFIVSQGLRRLVSRRLQALSLQTVQPEALCTSQAIDHTSHGAVIYSFSVFHLTSAI